jgi:hypothetical protein
MNAFRHVFLRCRGLCDLIQGQGHLSLRESKKTQTGESWFFPENPIA